MLGLLIGSGHSAMIPVIPNEFTNKKSMPVLRLHTTGWNQAMGVERPRLIY